MTRFESKFYADEPDELENAILLPAEVMNFLACGRSSFYRLVSSGELKAFRVGKQWRVMREDLLAYCRGER